MKYICSETATGIHPSQRKIKYHTISDSPAVVPSEAADLCQMCYLIRRNRGNKIFTDTSSLHCPAVEFAAFSRQWIPSQNLADSWKSSKTSSTAPCQASAPDLFVLLCQISQEPKAGCRFGSSLGYLLLLSHVIAVIWLLLFFIFYFFGLLCLFSYLICSHCNATRNRLTHTLMFQCNAAI